jgi:thymidylate synthase
VIEVENLRDGYLTVRDEILARGARVAPRGMPTREILCETIRIEDPRDTLPFGVGRKFNVAIGAAEALQLVGGFSDPDMLVSITKNFNQFLTGGVLHGAYGPRILPQMANAERRLRGDKDTRQAQVVVWDPLYDAVNHPDMPCTLAFQFMLRNDKLIMHATMRSNDFFWGLCYDAFQFAQLQLTMANVLGVEPGPIFHNAKSLHIYERDLDAIEALHPYVGTPKEDWAPQPTGFHGESFTDAQKRALAVWELKLDPRDLDDTERWYEVLLRDHVRATRLG